LVMGYTGYLAYLGELNLPTAIALAWLGTSIGMTFTYFAGRRLGYPFLVRYGPRLFLGPKKLKKSTDIFEKYGSKLLFFSFFFPGVRHFTGYLAGIMNIPFRVFAAYTYLGAFSWVVTFIGGGRILGSRWSMIHEWATRYGGEAAIYIAAIAGLCILYGFAAHLSDSRKDSIKDNGRLMRLKLFLAGMLFSATCVYLVSAR
jgi:membrane protein DedA with SNARE-associated domain